MFINLNPNTIGINASLPELIRLAKQHGFGGIDLPNEALASAETAAQAAHSIQEAGLEWGLFWLPADFSNADDNTIKEGLKALEKLAPLAQRAGGRRTYNHIWPGSHEYSYEENLQRHVKWMRPVSEILGAHNITLGIEFIGPQTLRDSFRYPFLNSLDQALELIDAARPHIGIVIDCFHWYCSGGTLESLEKNLTGRTVVNVHANDAPPRPREEQQDGERALPMAYSTVDAPGVLRTLRKLNYDGPVIAEPFMPELGRLSQLPSNEVAAEIGKLMNKLMQASL